MAEVMTKVYVFPIILAFLSLLTIIFMPKHLSKREIYVTWLGMAAFVIFTDIILNGLDMIEYVAKGLQPMVTVLRAVTYPALGVIFLNFMPQKTSRFIFYAGLWVLLFISIETAYTLTGYLIYYKWSIFYSAIAYILLCTGLRWHINFLRKEKICT